MAIMPEVLLEQVQFCETHLPIWTVSPGAVGLTAGQLAVLGTATAAARKAFSDNQAARQAARASTTAFHASAAVMRGEAADLIKQIKAFAELSADAHAVYAAAQIPLPAAPSPQPAPGRPENLEVTLESSGAVTLSWQAVDAAASSGAFYNITRKLPGQSGFVSIGGAPGTTARTRRMSYTDLTLPTSAAGLGAQYIITGRRGDLVGEASDAVTVQFGVGGNSLASAAGAALKVAA